MEKFLLSRFLACNKLNIVNEQNITVSVFLMDFIHRFLVDSVNNKINKILAACKNNIRIGIFALYFAAYGAEQVSFAQTCVSVNEKRIVSRSRSCRNCLSRRMGKAV